MLLNEALNSSAIQKPANKQEANSNIQSLNLILREVSSMRRGCHLSREKKKNLKRELSSIEDDVKAVLRDLKMERCRMR